MKERVILFTIVFGLGIFIYIFQSYFNTVWGLALLCTFMFIYALFLNLSYKLQKRKLQKYPQIINPDYKPFVSVLIPAHNEETVISATVQNILNMDYENFEVIVIDDRSTDNTAAVIKDLEKKYDKVTALIRDKVFKALRKLSPAKLEGRDKGNLIALITSDIELLEVFYAHTISPIAIGILTSSFANFNILSPSSANPWKA